METAPATPVSATSLAISGSVRAKGIWMVIAGASFWGLSGTAAQHLLQQDGFSTEWLVAVRMTLSGLLLLWMQIGFRTRNLLKHPIFDIWKHPKDRLSLILFSFFGFVGVQYTYYASIQSGSAPLATILQSLGSIFVLFYVSFRAKSLPGRFELAAVLLAVAGTGLLVTNGSWTGFTASVSAVVWGLLSGVAAAYYTVYPQSLIRKWGSASIVGWGFLIGGAFLCLLNPPWRIAGQHWNMTSVSLLGFVILFGTLVAFYLYLNSLKYISPAEASMIGAFEPLSATAAAVLWLHVQLGFYSILGGICVVLTVVLLSWRDLKRYRKKRSE